MKKWILPLLLACVLLCSWAQTEEVPPLQPASCAPGDKVELTLYLTAPDMAGLQLCIAWDPKVFDLPDTILDLDADFRADAMLSMLHPDRENGTMTLVWLRQTDVTVEKARVVTFPLVVREDAPGGETTVSMTEFLLTDVSAKGLPTQVDGVTLMVDAPMPTASPTPEPTATPEPTVTPEIPPEITATPEPTATPTPTATPEPIVAYAWLEAEVFPAPTPTPEPTATPTPTPKPTPTPGHYVPSRPGGSGGSVVIGTTPTPRPAVTAEPTPPTVIIGATPAPAPYGASLFLKTRPASDGFLVELHANGVVIGGLQATITYDETSAQCDAAAFSASFLNGAMVHMVNTDTPGQIKLVYSNLSGYTADGSAIFTARFKATPGAQLVLKLTDVKCTNADTSLQMWGFANQSVVYQVQPLKDLTLADGSAQPEMNVKGGERFSVVLSPGERQPLTLADALPNDVIWYSDDTSVASITADGLLTAEASGVTRVIATSFYTGETLAEGTVCVRSALTGLPLEIVSITLYTDDQPVIAFTAGEEDALHKCGMRLTLRVDEHQRMIITGLVPENLKRIPATVFDGCRELIQIEWLGTTPLDMEDSTLPAGVTFLWKGADAQ